jgi:hypothetical protein
MGIPVYYGTERAARALHSLALYAERRERLRG